MFVQRPVFDDFVAAVRSRAQQLSIGDALDQEVDMGPLSSAAQLDRVLHYVESGRRARARTAFGGDRATEDPLASGCFVPPTMFVDVEDDMTIAREEIFGPVVCALPFDDEEEVVRRANATPYGLAAGVWTGDIARVHRMSARLRAGTVWANCYLLSDPAVPFGGVKMSGLGREFGLEQLDELLEVKSVWVAS